MNSSLHFLGDKQLLFFLCLRTRKTLSLWVFDERNTHLCFEFISYAILSILYPYSCKTHNISSKLSFAGFLMESKGFSKKRCKMFSKRELTGCLTVRY